MTFAERALEHAEKAEAALEWRDFTVSHVAADHRCKTQTHGALAAAYASLAVAEELAKFDAVAVEERTNEVTGNPAPTHRI